MSLAATGETLFDGSSFVVFTTENGEKESPENPPGLRGLKFKVIPFIGRCACHFAPDPARALKLSVRIQGREVAIPIPACHW